MEADVGVHQCNPFEVFHGTREECPGKSVSRYLKTCQGLQAQTTLGRLSARDLADLSGLRSFPKHAALQPLKRATRANPIGILGSACPEVR